VTWTREQVEVLKELFAQGKAWEFIAHELGKTTGATKQRAWRLGLRREGENAVDSASVRKLSKCLLSPIDIASRIAALLKSEILPDLNIRQLSDSELLAYCNAVQGLQAFLRDLCGVELQDYQLTIVERLLGSRPLVCVTGRQIGKDFVIACFSLWEAITKANSRILVVSAAQRQSDLLNDRILAFIAGRDELYASVEKSGREELRFKNHSAVFFLPATGLIRGYTDITRAFFNEARDIPEIAYDAVTPMLSRRNGVLAVFSTPLGRAGRLWELWNSPLYEKVQVRSDQNKYLDKAYLEADRDRMGNASYRCEYEGEFIASQANFFEPESIQKAIRDYDLSLRREDGMRYGIGIDWGRKQDSSVMIVLGGRTIAAVPATEQRALKPPTQELRVQFVKSFEGVSFDDQVGYVDYLVRTFDPFKIVPETNGLGAGPCDSLKKRFGTLIEPFTTTNASKIEVYGALRLRFDRGEMTIPIEPLRLMRELQLLEYDTLPSGMVRIGHPSGEHDDFPDALALAAWAFREQEKKYGAVFVDWKALAEGRPGAVYCPNESVEKR
jgi:hypothetical protein